MNKVDHQVIRKAEWCNHGKTKEVYCTDCHVRQLLDENQNKDAIIEHLRQEVDIHAKELSKAVDENQALQNNERILRDEYAGLLKDHHCIIDEQAKEIERLRKEDKQSRNTVREWQNSFYSLRDKKEAEIKQLQADKAEAVEALRWYADDESYELKVNDEDEENPRVYTDVIEDAGKLACTTLQRIESGDKDETR